MQEGETAYPPRFVLQTNRPRHDYAQMKITPEIPAEAPLDALSELRGQPLPIMMNVRVYCAGADQSEAMQSNIETRQRNVEEEALTTPPTHTHWSRSSRISRRYTTQQFRPYPDANPDWAI
jgi:hypothetical protein